MPNQIILRTRAENFSRVIEVEKHALNVWLSKALDGDLLLLAKKQRRGPALVCHVMRFKEQRRPADGETEKLWNNQKWKYIIDGEGCCKLNLPFDPQKERVTPIGRKNYGPGGPFVYVDAEDAEAFRQKGLLKPFLE